MTDGLKDAHREAIIAEIAANDRVERAVLFGSRATGTNTVSSDVDIALFGDRLTLTDQARLAVALDEIPMAQSVDLLLYDSIRDPTLRKHIRKEGIEWFARSSREAARELSPVLRRANRVGKWRQGVYGRLPGTYIERPLRELCVPGHGIQTGPFGSQLHKKDYVLDGTPIVTVEHIGDNRLIHKDLPQVSAIDRERLSKYRLQAGDIVFSRVGSVDRRALVRQQEEGWLFSGRCLRVRSNPDQIDPVFLSYFFGLNAFREHIKSIAVGATMPSLNTQLLSGVVVPHPPLPEQRAIAHILGTVDDKIELNRRMNETLEAMARALFKSWFVDFDPVRAKMDGRATRLPQDIANLFPDKLVDSEIGKIPDGWTVAPLRELLEVNPKRSLRRGQIAPYLPMANMPTRGHVPNSVSVRAFGSGTRFANGDALVARITPCLENGKTAFVDFLRDNEVGWGSTEYIVLRPRPPLPKHFAYCLARSARFRKFAIQNMSGTSGRQRVPVAALKGFLMVAPHVQLSAQFGEVAELLFERANRAGRESRALAALRDTLLPKLISGEIRVPDAERVVEPVT